MRKTISLFAALALLSIAPSALAQGGSGNSTARCRNAAANSQNNQQQEYCFEGDNVRGDPALSNGANTTVIRPARGVSLIRHRAHFVQQMLVSVENF